jgi:hypothetical protein
MTRQNTVSQTQYIIVKHNSVIKVSTGPPTQDQQNFVRTSKKIFQFFLRTTVLHGIMAGPLAFYSEYQEFIDGTNYDKPNPSNVSNVSLKS